MKRFKSIALSATGCLGWLLFFVSAQVYYMVVAFAIRASFDKNYLHGVLDIIQKATNNGTNGSPENLMSAYIDILGGLTSYIEALMVVCMVGMLIIDRQIHKERFAFRKIPKTDIPKFIAIGIAINAIVSILLNFVDTDLVSEADYDTSLLLQGSFLYTLIGVGICAPICEEIAFRYFIFHNANRVNTKNDRTTTIVCVLFTSALFGVVHGNLVQGLYAFAFSIIFCLYDIKYKSIIPGLIMHITVNSLSTILVLFDSIQYQVITIAVSFAVSLIVWFMCRLYKNKRNIDTIKN